MGIKLTIATDVLKSILHRSLEQFGDKFSIKHVPNIVQNGLSPPAHFLRKVSF
jgi:hypothetical protein